MSGSGYGRARFLSKLSAVTTSDSGLTSSETRSVHGDASDAASQSSSSSAARGRAALLKTLSRKTVDEQPSSSAEKVLIPSNSGQGRAKVFTQMKKNCPSSGVSDASSTSMDPESVAEVVSSISQLHVSEEATSDSASNSSSFYTPEVRVGKSGTAVRLTANYIRLKSDPNKGCYIYEVRFSPNIDSVHLRMKLLNEHREKFGNTKTFDGVILYLPILLKDKLTTYISTNPVNQMEVEIRVLFKKKQPMKDCVTLYNVLFDRVMKTLNYVRFNRKQFDPTSPKILPHAKLEVWPGYVTAVQEFDGGLLLCCDVSHRVLSTKSVLEFLVETYHSNKDMFQDNAKKALLGSVVITRYNNKTYRIDDICFDKSPKDTFDLKNQPVSYVDYYKKNYGIVIKDIAQPLLLSIKKQRDGKDDDSELIFCLIPELCFLTGLRDEMRSDYKLMREIATFTQVTPNQRMLALTKFYENINNCKEAREILSNWGLTVHTGVESLTGRQMQEEEVFFAKKTCSVGPNCDFSRAAVSSELLDAVDLHNWMLMFCRKNNSTAQVFLEKMDNCTRALGITMSKPIMVTLENDRIESFVNTLRTSGTDNLQIIVIIVPTSRDDRYSAIKKICCTELAVPSQVINAPTLSKPGKAMSIVQKIALQINCKVGGSLWSVKIPFKNVMVCGFDIYHDGKNRQSSVSAFVASLNSTYSKWYSKAMIQSKSEEIVKGLCAALIISLEQYRKENKVLPDSVIIYRDGVSDSQLSICSNFEIPQLKAACKKFKEPIKISFIVVQKRINARFFLSTAAGVENPRPGTVADSVITRKDMYDFFLVSQSVHQGTVTPTHYIVLKDESSYAPDILQRLTYKICFMYYNWPGAVRIPSCCQYAHKLAYLVGQSVHKPVSERLAIKLYYL